MEIFIVLLFLIGSLLQLALLLFVFPKILSYNPINSNSLPLPVSVIVAAHNEKHNLQRLLPLLSSQNYHDFEIIVINDRSDDGTEDYLNSIINDRLSFITVKEVPKGIHPKKFALTSGIEKAKNEQLLFTDADCYPASDQWIKEMQNHFAKDKEVVLGYSPYLKEKGFLNLFIRFETILTAIQYLSFALIGKPYMGVGRNLGYSKKIFHKNRGFKENQEITGGDDDLFIGKASNSNNTSVCLNSGAWVYSIPKKSWNELFRQKLRHLSVGKEYTLSNKIKSALFPGSLVLSYFLLILSIFFNFNISCMLVIFILRTLILIIIFALITRKLGDTIKWYWFPLLDLSYLGYFLITGSVAIFTKNIKWK